MSLFEHKVDDKLFFFFFALVIYFKEKQLIILTEVKNALSKIQNFSMACETSVFALS